LTTLRDLICWCDAWLDDYYDFYEIEEDLTPDLVMAIKEHLEELQRIKERQGNAG